MADLEFDMPNVMTSQYLWDGVKLPVRLICFVFVFGKTPMIIDLKS